MLLTPEELAASARPRKHAGCAPTVSQRQLNILRHALGWPRGYRNHFCTGLGSADFAACEGLVAAGLMCGFQRDWVPDYIFLVTEDGKAVVG